MSKYRIIQGNGYNGCIPITIWWVQVSEKKWFSSNWKNIKGFDTYERAEELLNILEGGLI